VAAPGSNGDNQAKWAGGGGEKEGGGGRVSSPTMCVMSCEPV
jgi:hypothetical protein